MPEPDPAPPAARTPGSKTRASANPFRWLTGLLSSVRLGISMMIVLFVYCFIGSAGVFYPVRGEHGWGWGQQFVRQWRPFEMTEFEWFNTPVFFALIAVLCLNMAVVTVRRIRFNAVNLGVWMIHAGIISLAISSAWYFSTKVEGDTPVFRWRVLVEVPGRPPVSMAALAGNGMQVDAPDGSYTFRVAMMDPNWPIISPGFEGKSAYAMTIVCNTPRGVFMRQLLDGYPQLTQDLIPGPEGPKRVKTLPEFGGRVLFDDTVTLSLVPDPQDSFWVKDSAVMSVREVKDGRAGPWHERPLNDLPRYNDYADKSTDVFVPAELIGKWRATPLSLAVPAPDDGDPLSGAAVRVTGHLRYAQLQTQFMAGKTGDPFNPVVNLTLAIDDQVGDPIQLVASDPDARRALMGLVELRTVSSVDEVRALSDRETRRLVVTVPGTGDSVDLDLDKLSESAQPSEFLEIGGSGYAVRFRQVLDHRPQAPDIGALIDIRTPDRTFARWVPMEGSGEPQDFVPVDGEAKTRAVAPSEEIAASFDPGIPAITLVAGPGEVGLRAIGRLVDLADGLQLHTGSSVKVQDRLTLAITRYLPDARIETRPVIVPPEQRDKNVAEARSATLVRVQIDDGATTQTQWVPFDRYLLDDPAQQALVSGEQPARFTLADGRVFDIAVGRERMPLPKPVVLRDFELVTHVGGFSGNAASVRDWKSHIAFETDTGFTAERVVAVNEPKPFGGYWYFQSYWDAPNQSRGTPGMTFTGLGVGNRNGVHLQLIASAISVAGMIYAFYVKPIIKRRRAERVRAAVARGEFGDTARKRLESRQPVGAES